MIGLYLIRHAECEANTHPEIIGGRSNNSPLTANGKEQARKLYQSLKFINFDEIYCSPAVRAIETARIGLGSLERIIITDKLQELDQGEWTGKVRKDTYTPEILEMMSKDQLNFKAPGGESQNEVTIRMKEWLDETKVNHLTDHKIAAFAHNGAIKYLLRDILSKDIGVDFSIQLENTSITQIRYTEGTWKLSRFNDYMHLIDNQSLLLHDNKVFI